ncbi:MULTISPECIES: NAD(P)H-quinone oxidoreductase [Pseudonocardia]|uniref:Phthiocerol synthesis polyketide synthase type I PpsC n=2 Tax=Pseudonocardia TaxID=1847 RepID=A0A1Y2N4W2_PSEAH|nr:MULTISPECIES: NAD(P)H-quinone oxidoreductase [Pseudonocardia]OSY42189.1 Phthiocerol synthesis polyketide synthase type I PpsC [Pseudonocardia autotrophica]TDN75045.1 putative PIG3 family NAD(P)H quinone oxidoreductase [Pseudonocardia autotrophica]BBF98987.1 NAD(P)H quinone oxidoreductase [Pseudonocardia autotrophica]GEC23907.1 NAD(P)H quinone oxidoreductase [Pseudonocardia saturnea]
MKAITLAEYGGPEQMTWAEVSDPEPGPGEVLLDVVASAVNRADLLQVQGNYPVPPGASDILGLECSGRIAALGDGVTGWNVGDEVCALLAGGGYAQKVVVPAVQLLPIPDGVSIEDAGGLPEVACTVRSNVFMEGRLAAGETFLIQGGSSGIGTHAIQVAKAFGARVAATAGTPDRLQFCRDLGADIAIDYHDDVAEELKKATDGRGADVILDNMGAKGLANNLSALARDGRLMIIGMQGGVKAELNIGALLAKRGHISAMGLRGRPVTGPNSKAEIVEQVREQVWPLFGSGSVRPVVHERFSMADAADAHRRLADGGVVGKLLLLNPDA